MKSDCVGKMPVRQILKNKPVLNLSFATPKCNANPWRKVWEKLIKQGES